MPINNAKDAVKLGIGGKKAAPKVSTNQAQNYDTGFAYGAPGLNLDTANLPPETASQIIAQRQQDAIARGAPLDQQSLTYGILPQGQAYGAYGTTQTAEANMQEAGQWFDMGWDRQNQAGQQNTRDISNLGGTADQVNMGNAQAMSDVYTQLGWQDGQNVNFNNQSQNLSNQFGQAANSANAFDWGNFDTYKAQMGGYQASNNAALGVSNDLYTQLAGPMSSGVSWQGDLTSQAAGAYADPASIAAQNQALGQLQGVSTGSLDQISRAAQAQANAMDVANQNAAASALAASGNGANDVNMAALDGYFQMTGAMDGLYDVDYQSMQGYKDLVSASKGAKDININNISGVDDLRAARDGSKDIHVGQEDPEAYAAAVDARNQFKALTTPEVTAAERFIYEQARGQQEQDERANRAAVQSDFRQRGIASAGAEVGAAALGGQQTSQNRLLSDLGAQALAVNRSMQALGGYADTSTAMTNQANQIAEANQAQQMAALQQYAQLGGNVAFTNAQQKMDALGAYAQLQYGAETGNMNRRYDAAGNLLNTSAQVATGNSNRRVQAQGMASDAYAELRRQGFSEEYARGAAADNMSNANANRRLEGMESSGQLASSMRTQSFNEAFSRGTAADQTAQFNRVQSIGVDEFNANFNANERDQQWSRGQDRLANNVDVNQTNAGLDTNVFDAGRNTNADTFGRTSQAIQVQDGVNVRANGLAQQQTDRRIGAAGAQIGVNNGYWDKAQVMTGLGIQDRQHQADAYQTMAGQKAGLSASEAQAGVAQQQLKAEGTPGPLGLWTTYDDDAGHGSGLSIGA
jgi:hypothetical protein